MSKVYGTPGYVVQTFFQFLYPFISMICYNVVVGDTVTKVLIRVFDIDPSALIAQRQFVIVMVTLIITLPLSLYRYVIVTDKTVSKTFCHFQTFWEIS